MYSTLIINCVPRQKKNLSSIVSYSDDRFLLLEYKSLDQIFKVFDFFKKFSAFSNLSVNTDKTEIYQMNFLFSNEERNQLLEYGFTNDKISDGNQCLTFLGHRIKPSDLFGSAKLQLEIGLSEIKKPSIRLQFWLGIEGM